MSNRHGQTCSNSTPYGFVLGFRQALLSFFVMFGIIALPNTILAAPLRIIAFGDSLTAGLGLDNGSGFVGQLQQALNDEGQEVELVNAGVSGDTSSGGLERLDWSLSGQVDAVLLELGANDALRGINPTETESALDQILTRLGERGVPVLLMGMRAPPNMGRDYATAFDGLFPRLAAKHGVMLYPFFLDGVAAEPELNQADGIHPNAKGVTEIVTRMMPTVVSFIESIRKK